MEYVSFGFVGLFTVLGRWSGLGTLRHVVLLSSHISITFSVLQPATAITLHLPISPYYSNFVTFSLMTTLTRSLTPVLLYGYYHHQHVTWNYQSVES